MAVKHMVKTAAEFFAALDGAQAKLENGFQELYEEWDSKNEAVFAALRVFAEKCRMPESIALPEDSRNNNSDGQSFTESLINIHNSVKRWIETIEKDKKDQYSKGCQFIREHEKYLCIMVFGAVKSGKSSLGNLLAGREWLSAPFDNAYKHRPAAEFAVKNGRSWFCDSETTRDIQYFSLSGLRFFDTPGTDAKAQAPDGRNVEEIVRKYLPYADAVIFLMNSAEPGSQEDMKHIGMLSGSEQGTVIVIARSDAEETDVDDDGNLVKVLSAKSQESRALQENRTMKRMFREYPHLSKKKYQVVSISARLAQEALRQGDEQMFISSHIDLLMNKIRDMASSDTVYLKTSASGRVLNAFVRDIIQGYGNTAGIVKLESDLDRVLQEAAKCRNDIESRTDRLMKNISRYLRTKIQTRLGEVAAEMAAGAKMYNAEDIMREIFILADAVIVGEIRQEVNSALGVWGYRVELEPEGAWDHLRSWFGSRYMEILYRDSREHVKDDTRLIIDCLVSQLCSYADCIVRKNLDSIASRYFAPQQQYAEQMKSSLQHLKQQLEACRF